MITFCRSYSSSLGVLVDAVSAMHGPQPTNATSGGNPLDESEDEAVFHLVFGKASSNHGGGSRPADGEDEDEETHTGSKLDSANFFSVRPGVEAIHHFSNL